MYAHNLIKKALRFYNYIFSFILASFTLMYSVVGQAACVTPSFRVPMPASVSIPANVKSGDILVNWSILDATVTCTGLVAGEAYNLSTFWITKWYQSAVTVPFPDGSRNAIIYSASNSSTAIAGYAAVIKGPDGVWRDTLGNGAVTGSVVAAADGTLVFNFKIAMALVKTGTGLTGTIDPMWVDTGYNINRVNSGSVVGNSNFRAGFTTLSTKTCTISTKSVNVTLPDISGRDIPSINSTAGSTPFSIGLTCPQSMNVYMTLTDASNIGNQTNILGGMPASSVRGVGLQITNNSGVVGFGPDSFSANTINQFLVGLKIVGTTTIPLTVSYVRTATTITPGVLKSTATFTMSYQ